jgi:hypothetical protein
LRVAASCGPIRPKSRREIAVPSKKLLSSLLLTALLLPAGVLVVGAFGRLLTLLGDHGGGLAFERIALGGGVLWVLSLLGLLLTMAARAAADDRTDREE